MIMCLMLQILLEIYDMDLDEDLLRAFWDLDYHREFYDKVRVKSNQLGTTGLLNNVAINVFKVLHP